VSHKSADQDSATGLILKKLKIFLKKAQNNNKNIKK
jgi:hypothetical protein